MKNLNLIDDSDCENFNGVINNNFQIIDAFKKKIVLDIVTVLPPDPNEEDLYYLITTKKMMCYLNGEWEEFQTRKGFLVFVISEEKLYYYSGSDLIAMPTNGKIRKVPLYKYPEATSIQDTDLFIINKSGTFYKTTALDLKNYAQKTTDYFLADLSQQVLNELVPTGSVIVSICQNPPDGYIATDNKTIGKTGSSSDYEGDTYKNLYFYFWQLNNNPVDGTQIVKVNPYKGDSAQEDWDANKKISIDLKTNNPFFRFGFELADIGVAKLDAIRQQLGAFTFPWNSNADRVVSTDDSTLFSDFFGTTSKTPSYEKDDTETDKTWFRVNFDASTVVPTSDENRPKAITYNVFVKY